MQGTARSINKLLVLACWWVLVCGLLQPMQTQSHENCGFEKALLAREGIQDTLSEFAKLANVQSRKAKASEDGPTPITIPVVFQVIRDSNGQRGHLPYEVVANQIAHANQAFAGKQMEDGQAADTKIQLVLQAVNYWDDTEMFEQCETLEPRTMKYRNLQTSIRSTLNVFTCQLKNLGGWAYPCYCPEMFLFPDSTGVFIDYRFLPPLGGWSGVNFGGRPQRNGDTFVHEVGHAYGLLHPWSNGCSDPGDYVDDTPAQMVSFGTWDICPSDVDTCPDKPGYDDVRNFMDYSDDDCRARFTPGQAKRMHQYIDVYLPTQRSMRYNWECVAQVKNTPDGQPSYSLCKSACSRGPTPDGSAKPKSGWCYYHGGDPNQKSQLWGECVCPGSPKLSSIPGVPKFPSAVCAKKVCAVALTTLGGSCISQMTWAQSRDMCKNMGYRLCTVKETKSGLVRKALSAAPGCIDSAKKIWARNACKGKGKIAVLNPVLKGFRKQCAKSGSATPVCCFPA